MGALRRFLSRIAESDEERLAQELRQWSGSIAGTVRVTDAPLRKRVRIAGVVRRITVMPVEGFESLEAVIYDGSGEVSAVWLGRRSIHGLVLGARLVIEGVLGKEQGQLRIVNPTFEFA